MASVKFVFDGEQVPPKLLHLSCGPDVLQQPGTQISTTQTAEALSLPAASATLPERARAPAWWDARSLSRFRLLACPFLQAASRTARQSLHHEVEAAIFAVAYAPPTPVAPTAFFRVLSGGVIRVVSLLH